MKSKRRDTMNFATTLGSPRKRTVSHSGQNAFPLVLGGRPIQQIPLPSQFLVLRPENRQVGSLTVVKPSNLAEVRAKLKARKQKLG